MSNDVLTFDDVRATLDALGPAPPPRSMFAIEDRWPTTFPSAPTLFYGMPIHVSPYGDLDPRPIRYKGWKRFRAWYEASCRRMGAETPWEHLPTMTERSVLAMASGGIVMGPRTFDLLTRALTP